MNTNRDASQQTKYNRAKTLSTYYQITLDNINTGNAVVGPGQSSDTSAEIKTEVIVGQTECCIPNDSNGTSYYLSFTTTGSTTWTAPATIRSPITYWIVGGGGGGGGAYDNSGGGGGGGGAVITGTYEVVGGKTYSVVVGAGGAGGTGKGSSHPDPLLIPGSSTDGKAGTYSSFDRGVGGPVAGGGGAGTKRDTAPTGQGGGISAGGNGSIGGGKAGGGGGAGGSGTNGGVSAGTGGAGISLTIPGYNGGISQSYGAGGNGGGNIASPTFAIVVGASGSANLGNGGGGGSAASFGPPNTGGFITLGGAGGSGLVVIQYFA